MLNHSPEPSVRASVAESSLLPDVRDTVTFVLTRNVSSGEELTIGYGDRRSSGELLQMYGFAQPGNPHDAAPLPLAASRVIPKWKAELLVAANCSTVVFVSQGGAVWPRGVAQFLDSDGPLDSAAFAVLCRDSGQANARSLPIVAVLCCEALAVELQRTARLPLLLPLYRARKMILHKCKTGAADNATMRHS